jgi:hypothetical protein
MPDRHGWPNHSAGPEPQGRQTYPPVYEAPASSPRRKPSYTAAWVFGVLALVAVVAAVLVVMRPSTVRSEKVLDHAAVQRTIEQQSDGALTDVSCPSGEQVKAGANFHCTAANGQQIAVFIKDPTGDYVWVHSGPISKVTP